MNRKRQLIMKKAFLSLMIVSFIAVSCNTVKIEDPVRYGKLMVSLAGEPSVEADTRADDYTALSQQEAAGYNIYICTNEDGTGVVEGPFEYSELADGIMEIQVGDYYVKAESHTEQEADDQNVMRLSGVSGCVKVTESEEPAGATVNCDIANALVTVVFDESVYDDNGDCRFTGLKVSLNATDGSDKNAEVGAPVSYDDKGIDNYFNPCKLTYSISGTYKATSNDISFEDDEHQLEAGTHIKLVVKVNLENGQLTVSHDVNTSITEAEDSEQGFNPYK